MTQYPYLSLSQVSIDPQIARQLPRQLAYYYLALPLAQDEDKLTVVMAYPGNRASVTFLETYLQTRLVPVRGDIDEIRATLALLWPEEGEPTDLRILGWSADSQNAQRVMDTALQVGNAISKQAIYADASQTSLETVLSLARQEHYHLTVVDVQAPADVERILRESATPVLLVQDGAPLNLHQVLLVLRGHSPDESALDWIIPMSQSTSAQTTLLAVAPPVEIGNSRTRIVRGLAPLLMAKTPLGQHISDCCQRLTASHVMGILRLRQGLAEQEIAQEFVQDPYDLMVIAAEARGDFIQRVLAEIEKRSPIRFNPILVMKPTTS